MDSVFDLQQYLPLYTDLVKLRLMLYHSLKMSNKFCCAHFHIYLTSCIDNHHIFEIDHTVLVLIHHTVLDQYIRRLHLSDRHHIGFLLQYKDRSEESITPFTPKDISKSNFFQQNPTIDLLLFVLLDTSLVSFLLMLYHCLQMHNMSYCLLPHKWMHSMYSYFYIHQYH